MTESLAKISVIIPVHNGEKYIAQCLENILFQTYKNLEIIVVNDGSTDKSVEIAEKYPIKLINQENSGVYVARNRGIDCATGEYIHFMDADDLINLDYYTNMVDAIILSGADIACCSTVNEIKKQALLFSDRCILVEANDKFQSTNVYEWGYCWRFLLKKSFLDDNKLRFETGRTIKDLRFSMEAVYKANKIVTVPNAIYRYKKRMGSLITATDKNAMRNRKNDWIIAEKFRTEFVQQHNLNVVFSRQKIQYKIFGIPMLTKTIYNNNKTKWFLFGIYILQRKHLNV